jgi:chromate transporter
MQPEVQGFVKGAYAAAIRTILGASVLLGRIAIGDWLIVLIALLSVVVLFPLENQQPALDRVNLPLWELLLFFCLTLPGCS